MTPLTQLNDKLKSTGLPVVYRAWPEGEAPGLPFICYYCEDDNPLIADAAVFFASTNVRVELYTETKDFARETLVETALAGYPWQKTEIYISTEKCYMILYEIEV